MTLDERTDAACVASCLLGFALKAQVSYSYSKIPLERRPRSPHTGYILGSFTNSENWGKLLSCIHTNWTENLSPSV